MDRIIFYFLLFLIYSFIGWFIEVCNFLVTEKKFINRGFMIGPYCPIYGISSIIMIFYLEQYRDNVITVFLLAVFVCSIMEYLVSYIMEKLFNARWWDYSNRKFNINGRVCLVNAFLFGLLGIILVYFVNPFLSGLLMKVNVIFLYFIGVIWAIIFFGDFILSMNITYNLRNSLNKLKIDSTEHINKKVSEVIENNIFNRRIFKAFPDYKINMISIRELKDKLEDKFEDISDKIEEKFEEISDKFEDKFEEFSDKIDEKIDKK